MCVYLRKNRAVYVVPDQEEVFGCRVNVAVYVVPEKDGVVGYMLAWVALP